MPNVYTYERNARTRTGPAAKLDEDDPAKMSLADKMRMFDARLAHKPPVGADARRRAVRLRTMPVLASQVQQAMEDNERLTKSLTDEPTRRDGDFQLKMELFRSASARNTSLEFLMRNDSKFRSLGLVSFFFLFSFWVCFSPLPLTFCRLSYAFFRILIAGVPL